MGKGEGRLADAMTFYSGKHEIRSFTGLHLCPYMATVKSSMSKTHFITNVNFNLFKTKSIKFHNKHYRNIKPGHVL